METTVIIGAGASGLICGHELAKSNHNVIILEQSRGRKLSVVMVAVIYSLLI